MRPGPAATRRADTPPRATRPRIPKATIARAVVAAGLAVGTGLAVGAAPASGHAGLTRIAPKALRATVASVDGPARLTVEQGGRQLPLRLLGAQAPMPATDASPGECGAAASTDALRRMAPAGMPVDVELARAPLRAGRRGGRAKALRDGEGRLLAVVGRHGDRVRGRSFVERLGRGGWVRAGLPGTTGDGMPVRGDAVARATVVGLSQGLANDGSVDEGRAVRLVGLWSLCNGRFHLPAGDPVPPTQPLPWSVSAAGRLERFGLIDFAMGATSAATTLRELMGRLGGGETSLIDGVCLGWMHDRGLVIVGLDPSLDPGLDGEELVGVPDCAAAVLIGAATTRTGVPVGGAATGQTVASFQRAFPAATLVRGDDVTLELGPLPSEREVKGPGAPASVTATFGKDHVVTSVSAVSPALFNLS